MSRFIRILYICLFSILVFVVANGFSLCHLYPFDGFMPWLVFFYLLMNVGLQFCCRRLRSRKLRSSQAGCLLLEIFLVSVTASLFYSVAGFMGSFGMVLVQADLKLWLVNTLLVILVEAVVFWNGILRIYLTSDQLGIRWRVLGAVCGMVPILNLVLLNKLIFIVQKEVVFENNKLLLNASRKEKNICKTKYPVLMVHGVFFRDFRYFNYWGRVPAQLEENGAVIYYGNHQSAASVEECARELKERIRQIVEETGCEKVNIIAHSKGGLDSRYAIAVLGMAPYVASLTTINTPHRGCEFADYLLSKIPEQQKQMVADTYNSALRKLGDVNPDFLAAVQDLTAEACRKRNESVKDAQEVYYQSVGSKLNSAGGGRFPLNFTHALVKHFDGCNDGLVGEDSFPWGEDYRFITVKGKRGISHGDMIDLNRENFHGFDVREFYVQLVSELREKGF